MALPEFFERYMQPSPATSPRPKRAPAPRQSSAPANSQASYNPFLARQEEQDPRARWVPRGLPQTLIDWGQLRPAPDTSAVPGTATRRETSAPEPIEEAPEPSGQGSLLDLLLSRTGVGPPARESSARSATTDVPSPLSPLGAERFERRRLNEEWPAELEDLASLSYEERLARAPMRHNNPGARAGIPSPPTNEQLVAALEREAYSPEAYSPLEGRRDRSRMEAADFDDLSDSQQALVYFNTMLNDANRRDSRGARTLDDLHTAERADYKESLEALGFGEELGSESYAPNVVGLLSQLGFDNSNQGRDLDEFIDMSIAASANDLQDVVTSQEQLDQGGRLQDILSTNPESRKGLHPEVRGRQDTMMWLATEAKDKIQEAMTAASNTAASVVKTMAAQRNDVVRSLGGKSVKVREQSGFGSTDFDNELRALYAAFNDKEGLAPEQLFQAISESTMSDEQIKSFFDYADRRTRQEAQWGPREFPADSEGYARYNPERTRARLGLPPLRREG